jgi:hypothetical protein
MLVKAKVFVNGSVHLFSSALYNQCQFESLDPTDEDKGEEHIRNIDTCAQCYKTFYICNLRMFVISYSVYPSQVFQA